MSLAPPALVLTVALALSASAQDRFPDPIPTSSLETFIVDVATLPDSASGLPPRMNVMTTDPAGRFFVNDQRGPLYLVELLPDAPATVTEYLDLRNFPELQLRVASGEQGFQAFTFHPNFSTPGAPGFGKFYTIFSSSSNAVTPDFDPGGANNFHTLLLEWTTSNPASQTFIAADTENPYREVIRFQQPFGNHNAGLIAFQNGIDTSDEDYGHLYIALGDGGSGNAPQENGEDASNPYGALLRIDPLGNDSANGKYGIVNDNVFATDSDPDTLAEIYCYGLRNPQRFGWDTATGNCYIADIGQNAVEEINLAVDGANFGWDLREGSFPNESTATAGLTDPVAEYDHTNTVSDSPTTAPNRAITAGEVLRGSSFLAGNGLLWFGDFPSGLIFSLNVDTDPLDGGQNGIVEVKPRTRSGDRVQLLDLINSARSARGLGNSGRADLRFSLNTPGRVFILNKHDGILRELVSPPRASIELANGQARIDFIGVLQSSPDLNPVNFETIIPQPTTPFVVPTSDDDHTFFRSVFE